MQESLFRVNIPKEFVDAIRNKVSKKSLPEALFIILNGRLLNKEEALLRVDKADSAFDLFATQYLDDQGLVASIVQTPDEIKQLKLMHTTSLSWIDIYLSHIWPMLETINTEHYIAEEDLLEYCKDNPFIPEGHEHIFAKGLYYFLTRKPLESASILIPQIENSLRYLLSNHVATFKLKTDGTQESKIDIDDLLGKASQHKILPEWFIFNLSLLIGKENCNLRNSFAHGKLSYSNFYQASTRILLWLIFWVVMRPARIQHQTN
jgi:hypothetical protein